MIGASLLLALHLAAQAPLPTVTTGTSLRWEYEDVDAIVGVTLFLVCLDGQPTSACAQVAATTGVASGTAGLKTYRWPLPPLLAGAHVIQIQACTAGAAACSGGVTVRFTFAAIADPKNPRLVAGGGAS